MPTYALTNFEIQKYYQNEPRFNGVYSRDNFPKTIKDGAYIITQIIMQVLVHIGLLCIVKILKLFILTVMELNVFLKKSKKLLGIET